MIHYVTTDGIGSPWVAVELGVMERQGIPCALHGLRPPHDRFFASEWADALNRSTRRIYPLPPLGFAASAAAAPFLFGRRFFEALWNALTGERETLRTRAVGVLHLFVAAHWARALRRERVDHIHLQWVHSSGTVGMYGAWLLGVPFSFTGHAADLFRDRAALAEKVRRANFIVCISNFHREFYKRLGAQDDRLHVVYCGIDVQDFAYRPRSGRPERPRIVSVGRLVEKKGFDVLIDACKVLADGGADFECVIAGSGPLRDALAAQVEALGLGDRVTVTGKTVLQEDLPGFLTGADVFAQPCVWARDNDVDGTPRTLMEAMACGTPSVSTRLAGIPDIVEHERSGLLVDPDDDGRVDPARLAEALRRLIDDPALAARLSAGGRQHILDKFRLDDCVLPLADLFRARLRPQAVSSAGAARGLAAAPTA